ncbi:MAG: hypothetical protein H6817_10185 [Phycisphaerales bacterium]|nr:hypothetical protein [Phycisphaerales bacterium]
MTEAALPNPAPVYRSVPYLHVADVERSVAFYAHLGFREGTAYRDHAGKKCWASVAHHEPVGVPGDIFFAQASEPVDAGVQAVLLYMYSKDVQALRRHLLDCGLHDGGAFTGQGGPNGGRCVVFEVSHPFYMDEGEVRVHDPDGYCLLIGQLPT